MVFFLLIVISLALMGISLVLFIVCCFSSEWASAIAHCAPAEWVNGSLIFTNENIASLESIMIPQIAALLAICITVFVFLFTELNARAQDHPGERAICNNLQKEFALRVERLSVESIILITLDYFSSTIYNYSINSIYYGHLVYGLLVLASFWTSICMMWYCVDVAQYQRHLNWRAWGLLGHRYDKLAESYKDASNGTPEYPLDAGKFWSEYLMTSQLVCVIAGESPDQAVMSEKVIDRFKEVIPSKQPSTMDNLSKALSDLYSYQLALRVFESYTSTDEKSKNFGGAYSMRPVADFLGHLNGLLDKWNSVFRKRPSIDDGLIPGFSEEKGPSAAQIARGLWYQIVRGDGCSHPMESQRLHDMAFTGLNFTEGQLKYVRMQSCRLVRAEFDRSNLSDALFENCDLRAASFVDVDCSNLVFSNSNLDNILIQDRIGRPDHTRAILVPREGCMLVGISFDGCSMERALIAPTTGKDYVGNHKRESKPDDSAASDESETQTIDLSDANLSNVDLLDATICRAKLDRCTFKDAWLSGAIIDACAGESIDFSGAQFIGPTSGASLRNCEFNRTNFYGCVFSNAKIQNCKFPYLNGDNIIYENVMFDDVSFSNASLKNASLLYPKMNNISLEDTELTHAHIVDSKIEDCNFSGSAGKAFQILHGKVKDTGFIFAHLTEPEFSRTRFDDCRFADSSFRYALFHRAVLKNTVIVKTLLPQADFSDAILYGVIISHVFMTGSLFDRVKVYTVSVESSDLSQTMFRHTEFYNCEFSNCEWSTVSFQSARLRNCRFVTFSDDARLSLRKALGQADFLDFVTVDGEFVEL